ncbi:hypothetical protein BX616_002667 [Lobosporangium transversale]|uniref:YbaK/aminoacyl-tRNA synthetase-associated domain-containing protein n=1 Tax=Lobosporangium transversale TaxID=64571 RepID=A0A1Y2GD80_9FUNG|nr:YbaK/aminoacyl-tRNA synthetase-associated domain-containing protein [Lobosporangium transversale]KAF9916837.1 hypothetical protein BX616_002667 [Lobosporangium transversale]ORZ05871.1 YbaK/aminoacyl-tRNA synthetase-associated domain-containing protein [Lobosporangium transversale]|eukprot:XP_021877252.1 YbaK/aminoacyl-tRNA synthetase-associated domain-containing protein [Lobosporangium transversale]
MPESTVGTLGTQLMADANSEPISTLDDFLFKAATDAFPDNAPEGTMQVYRDAQSRLPKQCRFFHVASDYYDWSYEQRARVMGCPSTFHLCKTLIFENTKFKQDEAKAVDEDRYWCIIVQYEGAVNISKLEKAVRERTGASRKATHLRIASSEKSFELTGFGNNAVSPVGMRTNIPILISKAVAELSPPLFYLGAGHVDWKIALPVQGFVEKWNASIVDFC